VNVAERSLRRIDRFQQRHPPLAVPVAVIQKFGNDRAGAFATRIAYQALFSVFPLLLLFSTVLGWVLEDRPGLRDDIIDSALRDFPIIGSELRTAARPLEGSGLGLAIGIIGTLYGALGFGQSAEAAMNTVWNIPRAEWPNFIHRRLRSLAVVVVIGAGAVASALGAALLRGIPSNGRAVGMLVALIVDTAVFVVAFMFLTARGLSWRDVGLGAVVAAALWGGLKFVGEWYVGRVLRGADEVYGFFATVIALLTWVFVAAQLILLAAELNVVIRDRLWPRSLTQPPLTDGDREVFRRIARATVRRPEYAAEVTFTPRADHDPLTAEEEEGQTGDGDRGRRRHDRASG
jgi:YihY family inner membrane protein